MSHFTVIVIGDGIDGQMEPYAEQDYAPQYKKFEDQEHECKEEYNNEKVEIVVLLDGSMHNKYEPQFKTYNGEYKYPQGSIVREGSFSELYPTFEEFMQGWHGQSERDEETGRYGYWHNPNAYWDWYTTGGRWTGFFKVKDGAKGEVGSQSLMTQPARQGWVDSLRVCDIDFDGMKADAIKEANETYDKLEEVLQGRPLPSWKEMVAKHGEDIDSAQSEYRNMSIVRALQNAGFFVMGDYVETFGNSREEYLEKQSNAVAVPYAIVKDAKWYQKGKMGWFGMSSDEMTQDEWNKQFWEMINSLTPETQLTLLDCHI